MSDRTRGLLSNRSEVQVKSIYLEVFDGGADRDRTDDIENAMRAGIPQGRSDIKVVYDHSVRVSIRTYNLSADAKPHSFESFAVHCCDHDRVSIQEDSGKRSCPMDPRLNARIAES